MGTKSQYVQLNMLQGVLQPMMSFSLDVFVNSAAPQDPYRPPEVFSWKNAAYFPGGI